jgi:hypothetical protein
MLSSAWLAVPLLLLSAALSQGLDRLRPPLLPPPPATERLTARAIEALSFGMAPAATDWFLLRMLTDESSAWVREGELPSQYYELKLASELDPLFYELYTEGPRFLAVVRNDKVGSLELSEQGLRVQREQVPLLPPERRSYVWPSDFEVPFILGYLYLFERSDLPRAAEAFAEAARASEAPPYVGQLAGRLADPVRRIEVGMRVLNAMIQIEKDPKARERLEQKRRSLYVLDYLSALRREFRSFARRKPEYSESLSIPPSLLQKWFTQYLRENHLDTLDPFGGKVYLDERGEVQSTTPHGSELGLE